jgi:uncharacterized RDD family membrane protein YckC
MNPPRPSLLSALWLALALAILPALSAQEAPPVPAAPEKSAEAPAQPADPAETETAADQAEEEPALRELAPAADSEKPASEKPRRTRRTRSIEYSNRGDKPPMGSHTVPAGEKWREAVSIFGDTRVDGTVGDVAVSIMGNTTVNGTVNGEAVSVFGTTTINGRVKGVAVAVFGDVVLGPEAEVGDEVVVVFGRLKREPGATIHGGVQEIGGFGPFRDIAWLRAYVTKCVLWGRPLWFGENLGWAWMVAGIVLLFYMMLALIFPRGIERCAEILEQRPGNTILAALLTALLSPVLFILLAITGIGIVLIPFLAAGLFFGTLFGKASVCAWFGRRLTGRLGSGIMSHAVFAVLLGGIIIALLYTIPILGIILFKLFGVLGLGMVVYVLILSTRRERPAAVAGAAAMPAAPLPAQSSGFTAGTVPPPAPPPVEPPPYGAAFTATLPPVISAATLPRAGFWIRFAAALLDFLIIGIATALLDNVANFDGPGFLFFSLAAYSVVMWKTKGTTIGGVICGLKVVRLDDRPLDWGVAIVRALTGFLSFFVAGLGFIWVAFDEEKQSWHDKVAGTTIVRVPKGMLLL